MPVRALTARERPDLQGHVDSSEIWPEYNLHGDVLNRYWGRLDEEFPDFQAAVLDDADELVGELHSVPIGWDGTAAGLPAGIDGAVEGAFERPGRDALCALAAEVLPARRGGGLAERFLDELVGLARRNGLGALLAPLRPSLKERYPLTPIGPLGADARPRRRRAAARRGPLPPHHRHGRRVGGVGRDGVPGERRLRLPAGPGARRDRPRARPGRVLGAERLGAAPRLLTAALAALALAVPAAGAEPRSPRAEEAFFGAVVADAPAGASRVALYLGDVRVREAPVVRRRVVVRVPRPPGRYDLRVRFEAARRVVRWDEARRVWLLPASGNRLARERRRDAALATRLAALGRSYPGWAGLWVHDLRTGATAGWNSDASFPAASTVKLGVLVAALDRFGPRPERSRAWPLIRDLATWSSNLASNRLLVLLGGSESGGTAIVNRTLARLGASASWFTGNYELEDLRRRPFADVPRPLPVQTFRRTTAHDLGRILVELHGAALGNGLSSRRTGLSRHEARVALGLLLSAAGGENAGLLRPHTGVPLARKEGWTSKLLHTAAIAYTTTGPKVVVVLTFHPEKVPAAASRALGRRVVQTVGL